MYHHHVSEITEKLPVDNLFFSMNVVNSAIVLWGKKVKYSHKKRKICKWTWFKKYIFFRKHIEASTQLVQVEICNIPLRHKACCP